MRSVFEEFPEFSKQGISNLLMFHDNFESLDGTLISLRSLLLALTLSGLAGGEYLPLPRSKGGVSPSCSSSMGTPTLPQTFLRDMRVHKTEETPPVFFLTMPLLSLYGGTCGYLEFKIHLW